MPGVDGGPWSARAVVHPTPLYRIEGEPFRRADGIYDKPRFMAYLQLPRFQPYMAKSWNDRRESQSFPANLDIDPRDLLSVEPGDDADDPVHGGMRRADVQKHLPRFE